MHVYSIQNHICLYIYICIYIYALQLWGTAFMIRRDTDTSIEANDSTAFKDKLHCNWIVQRLNASIGHDAAHMPGQYKDMISQYCVTVALGI